MVHHSPEHSPLPLVFRSPYQAPRGPPHLSQADTELMPFLPHVQMKPANGSLRQHAVASIVSTQQLWRRASACERGWSGLSRSHKPMQRVSNWRCVPFEGNVVVSERLSFTSRALSSMGRSRRPYTDPSSRP